LKKAVVLLSGGLDSATALFIAKQQGFTPHTLSFDYGQRHRWELEQAQRLALYAEVAQHQVIRFDLRAFGGSALTADIDVPKGRDLTDDTIPVTYVPARNTIFLSFALAYAETLNCFDIFIGVNALDYSGYPDCRPEYIAAFAKHGEPCDQSSGGGRRAANHPHSLLKMTKAEIIAAGLALGVDYSLTSSCYDPDPQGRPCGACDSCQLRLRGFEQAGAVDPLQYG
jgi:7-cyano-7-deazaguanine synthase